MKNFLIYKEPEKQYNFHLEKTDGAPEKIFEMEKVSSSIKKNLEYAKGKFHAERNGDIVFREFEITVDKKIYNAFFVICDGLASSESVNECVLKPFMYLRHISNENGDNLEKFIEKKLLPQNQIEITDDINNLLQKVNFGFCILFVDTLAKGFLIDLKQWEHRSIDKPQNESVILGPHEGFNEMLRANTALIRKTINSPDLIMESCELGRASKTAASIAYIEGIANPKLVEEMKFRISNIDADYILTSLDLEQFIEESTFTSVPQILNTERPDRVCNALIEGKVAVVVSGSPNVLIAPATFIDFTQTADDEYLRYPFAVLIRFLRITAMFLSLFASAVFIAVVNYHQGLLLTDILFSLEASRQLVPFPSILELILMEGAFELIKEAGTRVPSSIGQTLGIVGGLVLGQAAVAASVVSPIMIIIVAITGIASFVIPDYSLSLSFRILRFAYILGAAVSGFLGILTVLFVHMLSLFSVKSFGVPFTAPFAPLEKNAGASTLLANPAWKKEERAAYIKSRDKIKQSKISRVWRYKKR